MCRILLKVLHSRVIAWKPSEQANMLISFGLPRPDSVRFLLHGHIRSYTKGYLRDLPRILPRPLPAFLIAMHAWLDFSRLRMRFLWMIYKVCPQCSTTVHIRRAVCGCGYVASRNSLTMRCRLWNTSELIGYVKWMWEPLKHQGKPSLAPKLTVVQYMFHNIFKNSHVYSIYITLYKNSHVYSNPLTFTLLCLKIVFSVISYFALHTK